jgi:hypothetical protein
VGFGCSSIEFTRIKVPEEFDMEVMRMDLNDPYIRYRAGFHERAIYQTAYNDMVFLHDKVANFHFLDTTIQLMGILNFL